jgi:hypothetical protein
VATCAALLGLALGLAAPAGATTKPPHRDNGDDEPVILLHGIPYGPPGWDCAEYWGEAERGLTAAGWRGTLVSYGYYAADTNCDIRTDGDLNTPLTQVARELAWYLYDTYTRHGESVDVLAESMGGLVIRSALTEVAAKNPAFPPRLYVEDVVTLSTPHEGFQLAAECAPFLVQCADMVPGSPFLRGLADNPQSAQGTDWTLLASDADTAVPTASALALNTPHKTVYAAESGLDHGDLARTATGTYPLRTWHAGADRWRTTAAGPAPVRVAAQALFWERRR